MCRYSIYLSTFDLLSFITSNTDQHEFSSILKPISCCNDVMSHVDCIIKRDFYLEKMRSCSKTIHGIFSKILVALKIFG